MGIFIDNFCIGSATMGAIAQAISTYEGIDFNPIIALTAKGAPPIVLMPNMVMSIVNIVDIYSDTANTCTSLRSQNKVIMHKHKRGGALWDITAAMPLIIILTT